MIICSAKHTKPDQIPEEHWKCPSCGVGLRGKKNTDGFIIDESADEDGECELLHEDDYLRCYACDYGCSGKAYALRYRKQQNLVTCPQCGGKGVVTK